MEFTPVILVHVATALGALIFGGITLMVRKGSVIHRSFGRVWVLLMMITALVSFGIRTNGHFSAIHLLSVTALVGVSAALYATTQGRIRAHRRGMLATYVSLVIAGAFTLMPGRLLGDLVWNTIGLV